MAIVGKKGTVSCYVGTSETLSSADRLPHVKSLSLPNSETEDVDVTDFDSEGKETEQGMTDYGQLEIQQHLNDTEYSKMMGYADSNSDIYFQCFVKDKAGKIVVGRKGRGTVKSVSIEGGEVGSAFSVSTTIKVSGKVTNVETEPTGSSEVG